MDLKDNENPQAKISSRLLPDHLADLLSTMVKMTMRSKVDGTRLDNHGGVGYKMNENEEPGFIAKDSFQNHMSIKLFNLNVSFY